MLINLRNALMTGKRLPYDAEVEYLESTGTQWIDTGVMYAVNHSYDVKSDLMVKSANQLNGWNAGGAFGSDGTGNYSIGTGGSVLIIDKYVHSELLINSGSSSQTVANYLVDGTAYSISRTHENLASYAGADGFPLFACRSKGSLVYRGTVRFYACQIYVDSTLVRDFIPVRVGTVGYLYDRVSGKLFGNAGTGDFVLGPDVVPVEYIESHGTEYIDTGVYLTGNHSVEIDFQLTSNSQARKGIFGGLSISRYGALLSPSNNSLEFGYGSNNVFYQITPDTLRHLAKQQKNLLYLDGVLIYTFNEAAFTSNFSAPLGNFNYTNYAPAQAKYYLSRWYDGDNLIRSFRPIRVGTEGAMIDVLTRRIYRNDGTGAFTYGNDLKYPIPSE